MINSRDISRLRSDVEANCRSLLALCKERGLAVLVTNTVRDDEYQAYLYEQGRTRPGSIVTNGKIPTFHSVRAGLAFDISKNVKGEEYSDPDFFRKVAEVAKQMGFTWGGDWKSIVDRPHFQWDDKGSYTNADIRAGRYPPPMPLYRQKEEPMTQEQFNKMMETYLEARAKHEPSDWSAEARAWAEQKGIIRGDKDGNMMYKSFCTREELAVFLERMAKTLE
ncbi:M15 family metallopeptidase [Oscillibacter hominis]|uniref:M15 family metallopeptidase n=1 Tax=Oscillibacter hominis TaxID=2763056 RepID=A0A7G9B2C3_9FIRM|nr:M15 family metallopeptidase [Oscillibacter hominis]QNL43704.1 M15 family metallopeptidase [Oscillibacter hominis]